MDIINKGNSDIHEYVKVLDDKNYWLEYVIHANEIRIAYDKIPSNVLDLIKHGSVYLLISNQFECFSSVPEEIYKFLILEKNIPEDKIVFLSGAKEIKQICDIITKDINNIYKTSYIGLDARFHGCEYSISKKMSFIGKLFDFKRMLALTGKRNYTKHFLMLNRRWRLHRPTIVALLQSKNLLEHGYVSLGSNDQNLDWKSVFDTCLYLNKDHEQITDLLTTHKDKILSLENLYLDSDDFDKKTVSLAPIVEQYYENSFCSIVTETYFYEDRTLFLTEKTFKPIAYKHPFILVGVPNSLEFLHELGYKTFHPIIDESYDKENNDSKRMMMIVNEIEKICKLSMQEIKEMSVECKEICVYNQKLLLSRCR